MPMAARPNYLDLGNHLSGHGPAPLSRSPSPRDALPSPRSGDRPPALSPLDAFALQGRMLAQKLEEGRRHDRRISRLLPTTIAMELAKPLPGYENMRPLSPKVEPERNIESVKSGAIGGDIRTESQQDSKHKSFYPVFHNVEDLRPIHDLDLKLTLGLSLSPPVDDQPLVVQDYFGLWKDPSTGGKQVAVDNAENGKILLKNAEVQSDMAIATKQRSSSSQSTTLARSRSPASRRFCSEESQIRSPSTDHSEEKMKAFTQLSATLDVPNYGRKASTVEASNHSRSPQSPLFFLPKPPPISSACALVERQSRNFSRPLTKEARVSTDRRPSMDISTRSSAANSPGDSNASAEVDSRNSCRTSPVIVSTSRSPLPWDAPTTIQPSVSPTRTKLFTSSSFVHAKFSVPRSRNLPNKPKAVPSTMVQQRDIKQKPAVFENHLKMQRHVPMKKISDFPPRDLTYSAITSSSSMLPQEESLRRSSTSDFEPPNSRGLHSHKSNPSLPLLLSPLSATPPPTGEARLLDRRQKPNLTPLLISKSTSIAPVTNPITAAEHLAIGISLHESGTDLQKSTYHIRLAAKAGLPDAMLMYALACRHGWGIRPNPVEGVIWLKRIVAAAGADTAALEAGSPLAPPAVTQQPQMAHSLAHALYELGVSYLNGWGVARSPATGLQYFSAAATLDDVDALVEAGECYAKGVGCKRDLKRAAALLRRAESLRGGGGTVGRSWIWKDKYGPVEGDGLKEKESGKEKERGRLVIRGLFGVGGGGGGGGGGVGGGKK